MEVSNTGEFSIPPAVAEAPLVRLGRYDLLGRMAVGGMAEIYLARERSAGGGSRDLVVKIIRPQLAGDEDFDRMFLNEGRVALGLKHPNLCHVYEFGIERGHYFIAMEYVHGVTLRELIRRASVREAHVPLPVVLRIGAQVAEALDAAHRTRSELSPHGVIHGDVSPQNIMVGYDGTVKLLDFGVAQVQGDPSEAGSQSSGTIRGKFGYFAPERCVGSSVDGRSDVFSLGVCLWEALTGKRLFKRGSEYESLRAIVSEPAPDPREVGADVPEEVTQIVAKALAKDADDRFQSAAELEQRLSEVLLDRRELVNAGRIAEHMSELFAEEIVRGPQLDRSPSVITRLGFGDPSQRLAHEQASQPARRSKLPWVLLGLIALVSVAGAAWWWTGGFSQGGGSVTPAAAGTPAGEPGTAGDSTPEAEPAGPREPVGTGSSEGAAVQEPPPPDEGQEPASAEGEAEPRAEQPGASTQEGEERERPREPRRRQRQRSKKGFLAEPDF